MSLPITRELSVGLLEEFAEIGTSELDPLFHPHIYALAKRAGLRWDQDKPRPIEPAVYEAVRAFCGEYISAHGPKHTPHGVRAGHAMHALQESITVAALFGLLDLEQPGNKPMQQLVEAKEEALHARLAEIDSNALRSFIKEQEPLFYSAIKDIQTSVYATKRPLALLLDGLHQWQKADTKKQQALCLDVAQSQAMRLLRRALQEETEEAACRTRLMAATLLAQATGLQKSDPGAWQGLAAQVETLVKPVRKYTGEWPEEEREEWQQMAHRQYYHFAEAIRYDHAVAAELREMLGRYPAQKQNPEALANLVKEEANLWVRTHFPPETLLLPNWSAELDFMQTRMEGFIWQELATESRGATRKTYAERADAARATFLDMQERFAAQQEQAGVGAVQAAGESFECAMGAHATIDSLQKFRRHAIKSFHIRQPGTE